MARKIVIQIVVDNRDAINAIKAQREQQKLLQDQERHANAERRKDEAQLRSLSKATDEYTRSTRNLVDAITKGYLIGRGISAVFGAVTTSISATVKAFVEFDFTMAKIAAISGESSDSVKSLEGTIRDIGKSSVQSAPEIAKLALEMNKIGLTNAQVRLLLDSVVALGTALDEDLVTSGETVVGILNAYNFNVLEGKRVTEQLAFTIGASALDIQKFGTAFSYVGGTAKIAGVAFEDLAGAMDVLSNAGIKSSTIGTQLRRIIADLSNENSKASQFIGGTIQSLGGFVPALEKLQKLLPKDDGATISILTDVFGRQATSVAAILALNNKEVKEFADRTREAEGNLERMRKQMEEETLLGALKQTVNLFKDFGFTAGQIVKPAVIEYLRALRMEFQGYADVLKDIGYFARRSQELLNFDDLGNPVAPNRKKLGFGDLRTLDESNLKKQLNEVNSLLKKANDERQGEVNRLEDLQSQFNSIMLAYEKDNFFSNPTSESKRDQYIKDLERISKGFEALGQENDAFRVMKEKFRLIEEIDSRQISYLSDAVYGEAFETDMPSGMPNDPSSGFSEEEFKRQFMASMPALRKPSSAWNFGSKNYGSTAGYKEYLSGVITELDEYNFMIDSTQKGMDYLSESISLFSDTLVDSFGNKDNLFENFTDSFTDMIGDMVSELIAAQVRLLIFNLILKGLAYLIGGGGDVPVGETGGTDVPTPSEPVAANGLDRTFTRPTRVLVGEAGPERVRVTPFGREDSSSQNMGSGVTIIVQGDVFNAEKLVDKVAMSNEMSRTRYV